MRTTIRKIVNINIYRDIVSPLAILIAVFLFGFAEERYQVLYALPLIYGVLGLLFQLGIRNVNGVAYHIINAVMVIRYIGIPLFMAFDKNYTGYNLGYDLDTVFWVMVYEMVVIYAVLALYFSFKKHKEVIPYNEFDLETAHGHVLLRGFYIFVLLLTVFVSLTNPNAQNKLFNFSFLQAQEGRVISDDVLTGPEFVFFKIGINVIYGLLITVILKLGRMRSFGKLFLCVVVSVLFVSSNWTGGGSISRWGLVTSFFVSFVVLIKAFPRFRRLVVVAGGVIFFLMVLISSITKTIDHHALNSEEALSDIFSAEYFNEYFQGPVPMGNGFAVMDYYQKEINFTTFLNDTISAYPWLNKLFYEEGNMTATFYHNYLDVTDKIIPTLAQGYAYFGFAGAPLFSGLLTWLALATENVVKKSRNVVLTVMSTQIAVWCSLFGAVNVHIVQRTTMYFVLFMLVYWADQRIIRGKKIIV